MPHETTGLLRDDERGECESIKTDYNAVTPLPWRSLFALLLLTTVQPVAFEIIFPFVNQMIVETGVVAEPERVGFYSGLIESIFSCMSFLAIMPAGYLADYIGRKPVIVGGTVGLGLSVASFGMSKSLLAMIITRCLSGTLGGIWACSRIMIGELTDRSNQATAFQWWSVAFRVGQVVGLPLGGLLAHPARHFKPFQTHFWYKYPFALPCFVASALALFSSMLGYLTLQETLPSKKKSIRKPVYGTMSDDAIPTISVEKKSKPSMRSILTPSIISVLVGNVSLCLASETLIALFPLFAFTPIESGGLGLSEAAIGTQLSIRAVLHIGMMAFYAPLERRFGSTVRLHRLAMWMWPLTVAGAPLLNYMARRGEESTWLFNITLFVFFTIWSVGGLAWTSVNIIINDATPSADALAALNGLSQMALALPQAITPALVTVLFAISIESDFARGNMIWIVLFLFTCATALHASTIHEPTSDWRKEKELS